MARVQRLNNGCALEALESRMLLSITAVAVADASVTGGTTAFSTASSTASESVGRSQQMDAKHRQQFTDADGDLVTVSLSGLGTAILVFGSDGSADVSQMDISGTNASSKVTITVVRKALFSTGRTTMGRITVTDGSLGSLVGSAVDLTGDVSVFGTLGTLTLGNLAFGRHTIETRTGGAGDAKAQLTMKLGQVVNTVVDTHGEPIKAISAVVWTNFGGMNDTITAPWLGQLTTTVGAFGANLVLDGNQGGGTQVAPKTLLTKATIKGDLQSGQWDVAGAVGSIAVGGAISDWSLGTWGAPVTSLTGLTAGQVTHGRLFVDHAIGSVKAISWGDGQIDAGSLSKLTITGRSASRTVQAVSGDFGADIALTRSGLVKATGATLGSASISGNLDANRWTIVGDMGGLTVGRTAGGAVDSPLTIMASGSMASLTLGAASHANFWAGMNNLQGEIGHAVSGQTVFYNIAAAIKRVTIKGWKVTPAQTFFEDSNFSAPTIGTSSLLNVAADPQASFGFWAKSLATLSRKDTTISPAKTYKSTSDLFAMDGLNIIPLA